MAQEDVVQLRDLQVIGHQEGSRLVDFIPSVSKLQGRELQKQRQTSLGDTLQTQEGVTSTQFGPSASRPVIRGLDGARIRVLQNSLGTLDASTQSLDHAIPVDALTLDSIEVVRGPMSLIYGSSAVGGVVNLVTNRIHDKYEAGLSSRILTQGETVNKGISSGAAVDYGADGWMVHLDGSTRNLQDQRIPGVDGSRKLPNSFNKQDNVAGGVSKIFGRGSVGASYNIFNTLYGTVVEEEVTIDMDQRRFEFHADYRPENSIFSKIRFKGAQSDYVHRELEGGETGTEFKNNGNETRLELINKKNSVEGVSGFQTQIYKFSADGEEAFLPESENQNFAVFSYQELKHDVHTYSAGARLEGANVEKKSSAKFGAADDKDFTLYNGSLGYQYKFNDSNSISTSLSYTERNANFQELYSNGAHIATGTFERGDNQLEKEKAYAAEVSYKRETKKHELTINVYTQMFHDFIFLAPTGAVDPTSGLPINSYEAVDARFYGTDLKNKNKLGEFKQGEINLVTKFDFVRAKNRDTGDNLPRISPPRVMVELEYVKDRWTTDLEVQYVADQTHTAPNETSTDAYTLTNLGYSYNLLKDIYGINFFARVRNIFDETARNHVSTLKEISPLPGRNLIVGAMLQF